MSEDKKPFVHLHVHTTFSLLDGISRRDDIVSRAKGFGMPAVAMTEHGNLFNAISFYKECVEANVKPILGMEAYISPDNRFGRVYAKKGEAEENAKNGDLSMSAYHLTLLAKNKEGYNNLKKLSTLAYREGFYRKPRIDDEILERHKSGLIVLSGCLASKVARFIVADNKPKALEEIDKMRNLFGDDFYLEVMNHNIDDEAVVREALIDFGHTHGIPVVMTGDSHFTEHGDEMAHEAALAIGIGKNMSDPDRWKFNGDGYWFKSTEEMYHSADMANVPEHALTASFDIAAKIEDYAFQLTSKTKKSIIPLFRDANGEAVNNEHCHLMLDMQAWQGLKERGLAGDAKYRARLEEELDLIKRKDFSSYFLIIADIIDNAMRKKGILAPIGRGSSMGSLVCYCLYIIGLDPIIMGIPFSRFINEGRKDLPDIDTDISQERRKEVIDYIAEKYGKDRVAQIVTFQSMSAKAAADNVGRTLGVPSTVRRALGKIIGEITKDDKLKDVLENNKAARELMQQTPNWIEISERLEGNNRNLGSHAAGIVISNEPLDEIVPLIRDSAEGHLVTQYDMRDLGELGLLKLDMLGLKTLDLIQNTIELVKERRGINVDFQNTPMDDAETFATVASGKFVSVFQYDSSGLRSVAKSLCPNSFEHLVALNALYRPGPMQPKSGSNGKTIMENYVDRRHGREEVVLWHQDLEPVFRDTFGLALFQEQIMELSKILGNFTDEEADEYRVAIGKKDAVKFKAVQEKLKTKGVENGYSQEFMDDVTGKMAGSARYNWNRGHCLRRGTKVLTCTRGWVNIQDIKVGENLWSIRHDTGDLFANTVIDVVNNGINFLRRITVNGNTIDCTDRHPFLTAEQRYVHATELASGNRLQMLEHGVSGANLNISMTPIANDHQIPFWIRPDDFPGDNMVERQSICAITESAPIIVPTKHLSSKTAEELPARSPNLNTRLINQSTEIKNCTWADGDAITKQSSRDSVLIGDTTINKTQDLVFNDRSNNLPSITCETPLFDMSTETGLSSFKREHINNVGTGMPISMQSHNQSLVNEIWVDTIHALITGRNLGPLADDKGLSTDLTFDGLGVGSDDMQITVSSDNIGCGTEHPPACNTNVVSHEKIINDWNVDSNIILNETDEVWDLTMAEDPNFIANNFVVHNSAAYSYLSYITAYLETHFPTEYYTILLNVNLSDTDQLKILLASILQKGVKLSTPHINNSKALFHTDGTNIYMGLHSVRQVGDAALSAIMSDRNALGPYLDYLDFCIRMTKYSRVNKLVKENLIKAGAFDWDTTSITKKDMVYNTELIQSIVKKFIGKIPVEEVRALVAEKLVLTDVEYTEPEKLENEKLVLNFYISSHPIMRYQPLFGLFNNVNFITPSQINDTQIGTKVVMLGVIEERTMKTTKNGDPYLALRMGDQISTQMVMIWNPLATKANNQLLDNQVALITGTIKEDKFRPGDNQIYVNSVSPVNNTTGLPISGFYAPDQISVNRVLTTLNATASAVSDAILHHGHVVMLKTVAYIRPEHFAELRAAGNVNYQLVL